METQSLHIKPTNIYYCSLVVERPLIWLAVSLNDAGDKNMAKLTDHAFDIWPSGGQRISCVYVIKELTLIEYSY